MSYQIYYKWKVFRDDLNNIFVFSLDGSNNCTIVNNFNGRQIRERDWRLFFRGSLKEFDAYLKKIRPTDNEGYTEGFSTSSNKSITREALYEKVIKLSKTADNIKNFKAYFYVEATKHKYGGESQTLEIEELYDYTEESYFNHNSQKEYLYLCDETIAQLRQKGY